MQSRHGQCSHPGSTGVRHPSLCEYGGAACVGLSSRALPRGGMWAFVTALNADLGRTGASPVCTISHSALSISRFAPCLNPGVIGDASGRSGLREIPSRRAVGMRATSWNASRDDARRLDCYRDREVVRAGARTPSRRTAQMTISPRRCARRPAADIGKGYDSDRRAPRWRRVQSTT